MVGHKIYTHTSVMFLYINDLKKIEKILFYKSIKENKISRTNINHGCEGGLYTERCRTRWREGRPPPDGDPAALTGGPMAGPTPPGPPAESASSPSTSKRLCRNREVCPEIHVGF